MTRGITHKVTKTELREKFISDDYPIHVIGRNVEISEPMRSYALEKMMKIERFGVRMIDAVIVMDYQRGIYMCDFLVNLNNTKILVSGRDKDMYAAIDLAATRLKSKITRYHRQLHELDRTQIHQATHPAEASIDALEDINDQIEEVTLHHIEEELAPHPVSKREKLSLKILNEQEAIWKMENNPEPCLMYISEEDEKIKVIYRQHDGDYGIMESE